MADSVQAGDYEAGAKNLELRKLSTAAITKGSVLVQDATDGGVKTAPTSGALAPFFVAVRAGATADTIANVGVDGTYYVVADGTILPNSFVMPSATTAGRVIAYTATVTPTAATATTEFRQIVGTYVGHADENDGKTRPTSASAGEIIRVIVDSI